MELFVLGGLALFILLAALADNGEPETETLIITRPVVQPQQSRFLSFIGILLISLLLMVVLQRIAELASL